MALVTCHECGKDVSSQAASCIHCGAPMGESRAVKAPLQTIQETSKDLKKYIIVAAILFWGGLLTTCSLASGAGEPSHGVIVAATMATMGGFILWLVTRIRIWWHHK